MQALLQCLSHTPLKGYFDPQPAVVEEVAALVSWLASDQCTFSTGAVYDLSGGRATY